MATRQDLLPTINDPRRLDEVRLFSQRVAEYFDRQIGQVIVTEGAQVGDVRRFTLQVVDRRRRPLNGRWPVMVYVSETEDGDPSGTDNVVTLVTGVTLATYAANAAYLVLSDEDGVIVLDLDVTGAVSRYVSALVLGCVTHFGPYTWA